MMLGVLTGWLERREREAIAYLVEENAPSASVGRATAAVHGRGPPPVGGLRAPGRSRDAEGDRHDRHAGHVAAGIGSLIARKWTYASTPGRRGEMLEIQ